MIRRPPDISVIIPTYNRSASLRRTLNALNRQKYPLHRVEVVVVADGCTDDTAEMLRGYQASFDLRSRDQTSQGAAAARNYGASVARGPLLLFLDDDIEPTQTVVEAHIQAHERRPGHVIIGPYPLVFDRTDFFRVHLRAWWEAFFESMHQPGHRFTYRDLVGGNLSIGAGLFAHIGGFDPAFPMCGGEDYEFGVRLIKARVPFAVATEAMAYHHDCSDMNRSFIRKRQEGRADVLIARKHPAIIQSLHFAHIQDPVSPLRRILRSLAFYFPHGGDSLARLLRYALELQERVGLRIYWRRLLDVVQYYWYYRGVAEKLSSVQALTSFVRECKANIDEYGTKVEIDLKNGLEEAERQLDEERPAAVAIRYGQQPIGHIPTQPGVEALRGAHLRPILANAFAVPLLEALALEGAISQSASIDRLRLSRSIRSLWTWFGPVKPGQMWWEQYAQWKRLKGEESQKERAIQDHWDFYRKLTGETAWLKEQCKSWQRLAEERERELRKELVWTDEFEQQKAKLMTE